MLITIERKKSANWITWQTVPEELCPFNFNLSCEKYLCRQGDPPAAKNSFLAFKRFLSFSPLTPTRQRSFDWTPGRPRLYTGKDLIPERWACFAIIRAWRAAVSFLIIFWRPRSKLGMLGSKPWLSLGRDKSNLAWTLHRSADKSFKAGRSLQM